MPELTDKSCGAGRPDGFRKPYRLSTIPHCGKCHDTRQEIAVAIGQTLQAKSGCLAAANRKYDDLLENSTVILQRLQRSPERVDAVQLNDCGVFEAL